MPGLRVGDSRLSGDAPALGLAKGSRIDAVDHGQASVQRRPRSALVT
jgi:hypothetical protein